MTEKSSESSDTGNISRRAFLKYSAGVAAVTAASTVLMDKIPSSLTGVRLQALPINQSSEPIVAAVDGDQITVMSGHLSVKVKDSSLAGLISEKLQARK